MFSLPVALHSLSTGTSFKVRLRHFQVSVGLRLPRLQSSSNVDGPACERRRESSECFAGVVGALVVASNSVVSGASASRTNCHWVDRERRVSRVTCLCWVSKGTMVLGQCCAVPVVAVTKEVAGKSRGEGRPARFVVTSHLVRGDVTCVLCVFGPRAMAPFETQRRRVTRLTLLSQSTQSW